MTRLNDQANAFSEFLGNASPEKREKVIAILDRGLLFPLMILLGNLDSALQAETISESNLPENLRNQYITAGGQYRVQVFPYENITNIEALQRFVTAVRTVAPQATDAPVTILESGRAIVSAFATASLTALLLIALVLFLVLRNFSQPILIMIPLLLAILLSLAGAVLLGIPFNFANVIVVPLLLGIGVDYCIHLVHRYHSDASAQNTNLLSTSTARGVFFSALTTIVSFGSLAILTHRGTASMGKLLTLSISLMIICALIVLPALLTLSRHYQKIKTSK